MGFAPVVEMQGGMTNHKLASAAAAALHIGAAGLWPNHSFWTALGFA